MLALEFVVAGLLVSLSKMGNPMEGQSPLDERRLARCRAQPTPSLLLIKKKERERGGAENKKRLHDGGARGQSGLAMSGLRILVVGVWGWGIGRLSRLGLDGFRGQKRRGTGRTGILGVPRKERGRDQYFSCKHDKC